MNNLNKLRILMVLGLLGLCISCGRANNADDDTIVQVNITESPIPTSLPASSETSQNPLITNASLSSESIQSSPTTTSFSVSSEAIPQSSPSANTATTHESTINPFTNSTSLPLPLVTLILIKKANQTLVRSYAQAQLKMVWEIWCESNRAKCGLPPPVTAGTTSTLEMTSEKISTPLEAETTTFSINTTILPLETTPLPVETTSSPLNTTVLPLETTTLPMETTSLSLSTTVETTILPLGTTILPLETTILPLGTTILPLETTQIPAKKTDAPEPEKEENEEVSLKSSKLSADINILDLQQDNFTGTLVFSVQVILEDGTKSIFSKTAAEELILLDPLFLAAALGVDKVIVPGVDTTTSSAGGGEGGGKNWVIAIIVVVIVMLVVLLIGLIVALKRKQRAEEMYNFNSRNPNDGSQYLGQRPLAHSFDNAAYNTSSQSVRIGGSSFDKP